MSAIAPPVIRALAILRAMTDENGALRPHCHVILADHLEPTGDVVALLAAAEAVDDGWVHADWDEQMATKSERLRAAVRRLRS